MWGWGVRGSVGMFAGGGVVTSKEVGEDNLCTPFQVRRSEDLDF